MSISTLRPVTAPRTDGARAIAPALAADQPINLALVANGKPNSAELLDLLAARVARRLPVREIRRYRKPSVSVPPLDSDLSEIAEWAHAVLTAIGD